jgi:hypothetical protein
MFDEIRNKNFTPKFKVARTLQKASDACRKISAATSDKRTQLFYAAVSTTMRVAGDKLFYDDANDPKKEKERI